MKIVYSLGSLGNSGGIERVISTKANYFADVLGYEVHIVLSSSKPESLFYHFSDKIHFHYLELRLPALKPWNYFFSNRKNKGYRKALENVLLEIKPDITITPFGRDASFLYQLKDGSQKVLEFHFTKNYLRHLGKSLKKDKFRFVRTIWLNLLLKQEERLASHYNHIVLLTEKDKQLWGGRDKFKVISNPLSFKSEQTAKLENKVIVSMGRLVYAKGFDYLIRAFALLKDRYPDWKVYIYGDGPNKEAFQNEINLLSLRDFVFLKEPTTQVEEVLLNASLFVLPTLYDGFGLVLTEAMTCGVPCVAFDCECGPSDILTDQEDGLLVELKNTQDLSEKMELLMSDFEQRTRMGRQAKANAERFTLERIMTQWNEYLNQIANQQ